MCRWFAYISPSEPCLLADVLINPAHAITKQVAEHYLPGLLPSGQDKDLAHAEDKLLILKNHLLNFDGCGIAWYTNTASAYSKQQEGPRPAMYKTQSPPTNDFNFRNLCENIETTCLFAHIRATSGTAVTPLNNHPFSFGRHIFMHNGRVADFTKIKREICMLMSYDCFANVLGSTDSEHAAALYMTYLTGGLAANAPKSSWEKSYPLDAMKAAMAQTVVTIMELQARVQGTATHANNLNFVTTDGQRLVCTRFRNHAHEYPCSLYWSGTAGRSLNRKYPGDIGGVPDGGNPDAVHSHDAVHGKHIIIASEPTTYDEKEWILIKRNHIVAVDEFGVESEQELVYDPKLNARSEYTELM